MSTTKTRDVEWARDFIARCEAVAESHGASFGTFVFESLTARLAEIRKEVVAANKGKVLAERQRGEEQDRCNIVWQQGYLNGIEDAIQVFEEEARSGRETDPEAAIDWAVKTIRYKAEKTGR